MAASSIWAAKLLRDRWDRLQSILPATMAITSSGVDMTTEHRVPTVSIGHVTLNTPCMSDSIRFMQAIGMQMVFEGSELSILELCGGTHLLLFACDEALRSDASFDLMVDDLHALHRNLSDLGYELSPIEKRPEIGHECFSATDPSGARIACYSSHKTCAKS